MWTRLREISVKRRTRRAGAVVETEVEGVSLPSVKLHTQRSCTEPAHHPQLVPVCVCACTHVVQYTPRCLPFCPAVPGDSTQQNVLGAHPRGSLGLSPPPRPPPRERPRTPGRTGGVVCTRPPRGAELGCCHRPGHCSERCRGDMGAGPALSSGGLSRGRAAGGV